MILASADRSTSTIFMSLVIAAAVRHTSAATADGSCPFWSAATPEPIVRVSNPYLSGFPMKTGWNPTECYVRYRPI